MDSVLGMVLPYDQTRDVWGVDKQRMEYAKTIGKQNALMVNSVEKRRNHKEIIPITKWAEDDFCLSSFLYQLNLFFFSSFLLSLS